ncbi:MAG: hypothetical protein M1814_006728 [Vezdaea aestivalis]|nr:MAG: hypothetical protein M1814_006728 [Vezdaea aestivalis]
MSSSNPHPVSIDTPMADPPPEFSVAQPPSTTSSSATPPQTSGQPVPVAPLGDLNYSASTNAILERMPKSVTTSAWEAARNAVLSTVQTSDNMPPPSSTPTAPALPPVPRGGRSGRGARPRGAASTAGEGSSRSPVSSTASASGLRGRGRRGGKRGGKRKRTRDDDMSSDGMGEDGEEGEGTDNGGYTALPTKSRSGRKIQRPTHFDPAKKTPSKRRGTYKRGPELGICRHCGRGAWTAGNKIVFCDGCQSAWHQFCHWPVITKEVIEEEGREFFCKECVGGKDGDIDFEKLRKGQGMTLEEVSQLEPVVPDRADENGTLQKKSYLQAVPPPLLIKLLIHASTLQPSLPLFPPIPDPSQTLLNGEKTGDAQNLDQSLSIAALYPPAGAGIALSTDSVDLGWLQDSDPEVFSHIYREDIATENAGVGVAA